MTIKISENLDMVYWSDKENEVHAEPLDIHNRDYWIKLAAENSNY